MGGCPKGLTVASLGLLVGRDATGAILVASEPTVLCIRVLHDEPRHVERQVQFLPRWATQ